MQNQIKKDLLKALAGLTYKGTERGYDQYKYVYHDATNNALLAFNGMSLAVVKFDHGDYDVWDAEAAKISGCSPEQIESVCKVTRGKDVHVSALFPMYPNTLAFFPDSFRYILRHCIKREFKPIEAPYRCTIAEKSIEQASKLFKSVCPHYAFELALVDYDKWVFYTDYYGTQIWFIAGAAKKNDLPR